MNRLCIETRGAGNWRDRLAKPDGQWKRRYSAFETAVSWECAAKTPSGLPKPILDLFRDTVFAEPTLALAIAEHKVSLPGGVADSQCDVWAILNSTAGGVSLSVEAKAKETFGQDNEPLSKWLGAGKSDKSRKNREVRWGRIKNNLPNAAEGSFSNIAYQLLHRCAAAVIEAKRFRLPNAGFVVQAFDSPAESFEEYSRFCQSIGIEAGRGKMNISAVEDIRLGVGWADCPLATDSQIADVL